MTKIHLYNTRTRKKELFQPIDPTDVRMYVCGPTVYDRAHIGNARPVVVFDVLYRLLRHVYGEASVTYARNFTDVDDRIINRAVETKGDGETLEAACRRITDETIAWYHEDMDALGALRPNHEPRCTEYIPQMVTMTGKLIAEGHAYEAEGHVLFAVETYDRYGKLAGRSLDDMLAGSRVEVAPYKKNPMDFILWKPSTPEQPGWDSPWGRGRPGWHIECSAMAQALLGDVFDIHGGGIDLQFPHHENEVAQSCCANHTEVMANVWMHNGFLQVEGEKMAKSMGNFFTVKDLRDKRIPGPVIRFVLLSSHYREPLDWTLKAINEADRTLERWGEIVNGKTLGDVPQEVIDALADDLNTPQAITVLHSLAKEERAEDLFAAIRFLGLGVIVAARSHAVGVSSAAGVGEVVVKATTSGVGTTSVEMDLQREDFSPAESQRISDLLSQRKSAREQKQYHEADRIRDALIAAGIEIKDAPEGSIFRRTSGFDPQKLEALK
jgi:cysteinyl-tRNA synthetase